MDRILLIDKPSGMTSFGVVSRIRRVLTAEMKEEYRSRGEDAPKRLKVGHSGTLDPFATGLLIILVGKATKKANEFLKLDKEYIAEIELGSISSTGDIEGEIQRTGNSKREPGYRDVKDVVESFLGEIEQRVPTYSAVKINGERAYKLARRGKDFTTPTRKVKIYGIEIESYNYPKLAIKTKVSSGTYIRTLGEDIGKKLGVGAYLTNLRRTQIGDYRVEDAVRLEDFLREESGKRGTSLI